MLTAQELTFIRAMASHRGLELSNDDAAELIRQYADRDGYALIRNLAEAVSTDERAALIAFIASICAMDDRISKEESAYLESLL